MARKQKERLKWLIQRMLFDLEENNHNDLEDWLLEAQSILSE
jgi:hypothetical protein